MKKGFIIVTAIFLQSLYATSLDQEKARCLFSILFKSLQKLPSKDNYIQQLLSLTQNPENVSIIDDKIMEDINLLMINYEQLDQEIQNEIKLCHLDLRNTQQRCEQFYQTPCQQINEVQFQKQCPKGYLLSNNYFCFPKCPENFVELKDKCKKPASFTLTVYGNQKTCQKETQTDCDAYMNDSIFTGKCGDHYTKIFKTICLPECPKGQLDGGLFCEKRQTEFLGNFFSFNFRDLFK